MHSCPECGQACDCDGEDTWLEDAVVDIEGCGHQCEEFDDEVDDSWPDWYVDDSVGFDDEFFDGEEESDRDEEDGQDGEDEDE